ncbi:MAG: NADH-quinone oxidoreductase subunit NuoE [Pseudomonadota bacterium]
MSVVRPAKIQPKEFAFSEETLKQAEKLVAKYPADRRRSAVIPLLWVVQKQHENWLPLVAIKAVADYLGMPEIRVFEVATFYSMFNLQPVGKYFIQVCGTTPCMLAGSDEIIKLCKSRISPEERKVSEDGNFSWLEVECLGACANAPMVQINDDYFEDLDQESFARLLDDIVAGRKVKVGPQNTRFSSEPEDGPTVLEAYVKEGEEGLNATAKIAESEWEF